MEAPRVVDGKGLLLRPYGDADVDVLLSAFADPEIARWNPGPTPADRGTVGDWMRRRNDWQDRTHASWAVAGVDGQLLGAVSLHQIDLEQNDAEIGYWLAPWARGRGHAVSAVRLASCYAFDELRLHRLQLYHAVENPASCRVATRAGFPLEGELRQSYRYHDGGYHDEHLHARLASDDVDAGESSEPCRPTGPGG